MAKEGNIIDYDIKHGVDVNQENAILSGAQADPSGLAAMSIMNSRYEREQQSYQVTEGVLNDLEKNLGVKTEGNFKENVGKAARGDFEGAGLDWRTGQDFAVFTPAIPKMNDVPRLDNGTPVVDEKTKKLMKLLFGDTKEEITLNVLLFASGRIFKAAELIAGFKTLDFAGVAEKSLLLADDLIKNGQKVYAQKIDLMGGETSQLGKDYLNIDKVAKEGIQGDVNKLSQYVESGVKEVVVNNPRAKFLEEVSQVLDKDGKIIINGQYKNGYFNEIAKMSEQKLLNLGYERQIQNLLDKYKNINFYTEIGKTRIPNDKMSTIILTKIK